MPNVAVHFLFARRALRHWLERPASAPFPAGDPAAVDAFLYGSVAPDAGYWPGGDRLFSELAHLWRAGDLARALGEAAGGPVQRAYAWGWASHVLADLLVHPLINEANGELVHGTRDRPVSSTDDVLNHMRLEYGLDVAVFARHPDLERMRVRRALHASAVSVLDEALRATWGWGPPRDRLVAYHATAAWAVRLSAVANRVHGARWTHRPLSAAIRALAGAAAPPRRWLPGAWNGSAAAAAVLSPLPSPSWLVAEVESAADRFPETIGEHRDGDVPSVPNHDLITGAPEQDFVPPRTADALRELAARGGGRALTRLA
jgi:hypothetical protein